MKAKTIEKLISDITVLQIKGDTSKMITDVVCDSRLVTEDCLFVAVRGVAVDAHQFLDHTFLYRSKTGKSVKYDHAVFDKLGFLKL